MEVFLRFLYSGTLNVDVQTLVEVMVIADKYQVPELSRHCDFGMVGPLCWRDLMAQNGGGECRFPSY